jgi:hypothetical protein
LLDVKQGPNPWLGQAEPHDVLTCGEGKVLHDAVDEMLSWFEVERKLVVRTGRGVN